MDGDTTGTKPPTRDPRQWLDWARSSDDRLAALFRDGLVSVSVVLVVLGLLVGLSGVWPPLVAVKSGSMQPHLYRGDLVLVIDEHRYQPSAAVGHTGVVTARMGRQPGYRSVGGYGDVIVFRPDGVKGVPVIHRATFWVNRSENWVAKANQNLVPASGCSALPNCPAPHQGFITKGDDNPTYDQALGISRPVRPAWVIGRAEYRVPLLGHIRLAFTNRTTPTDHQTRSPAG